MHLDPLIHAAAERQRGPFDLVVHLGAGGGTSEHYEGLPAARMVLVEGDPDVADGLRARCSDRRFATDVVTAVMAPSAGPLTWYSYNLRPLSGPRDALALRRWYPRLEETGRRTVHAVALPEWLDSILPPPDTSAGRRRMMLVLDLPGQEAALLAALSVSQLQRFDWIVVRRWRDVDSGSAGTSAVDRQLADAGFARDWPGDTSGDSMLVQVLYRFDERSEQLQRLTVANAEAMNRCAELEDALAATQVALQATEQRCAETARSIDETRAQAIETATAEWASKCQAADQLARTRTAELEASQKQLAEERKNGRVQAQRIEKLEAELLDLQFRLETMHHELLNAEGQLEVVKDLLLTEPTL